MGDALTRLVKRVGRVSRATAHLLDAITDMEEELREVARAVAADSTGRLDAAVECGLLRVAKKHRQAVLRAAMAGAQTLEMREAAKGGAVVRIDEGRAFRLSCADARLLRALTNGGPPDKDGFPAWRTYDQLAGELRRPNGQLPTRRAVVESVYRVRRALEASDLNPYLLKVDRKTGRLRFLLRPAAQRAALAYAHR
jgi:hypothetical protein